MTTKVKKLPLYRLKHNRGAKFRAHDSSCASAFREDRRAGLIYGALREADGHFLDPEPASVKYNYCVYCGTR